MPVVGTIAELPALAVAYVAGDAELPVSRQAPAAIAELESHMNLLRGRKFYGVVLNGQYRACVALPASGTDEITRLDEFTIPGGRYLCRRLSGFLVNPASIGELVDDLIEKVNYDSSRPIIEFYRGHDEMSIRVPVHG